MKVSQRGRAAPALLYSRYPSRRMSRLTICHPSYVYTTQSWANREVQWSQGGSEVPRERLIRENSYWDARTRSSFHEWRYVHETHCRLENTDENDARKE